MNQRDDIDSWYDTSTKWQKIEKIEKKGQFKSGHFICLKKNL